MPDAQEAPEARAARLAVIAQAIAETAAEPPVGWRAGSWELAAALAKNSYDEGQRWHPDVHSGRRRGDHGRAACLNQIWAHYAWFPRAEWRASMGTDLEATRVCMRGAARILAHYSTRCTQPWMGVETRLSYIFAGYGTGLSCNPKGRPWAYARARGAASWLLELEELTYVGREALAEN